MKVAVLILVLVISIGSSVVAAPFSSSSRLPRQATQYKLGYAAVLLS